jgi:hypothetical protein
MCLIVHRMGHDCHLDVQTISLAAKQNPDGFGLTWRDLRGELHTKKFAPGGVADFRYALGCVDAEPDTEYVAHFRKATHGPATTELAHPYEYEDEQAGKVLVFHNGIISIKTRPTESDTQVFVRDILANLPPRWWHDPALYFLVSKAIGWSRLLFLTDDASFKIGSGWTRRNGIWFSRRCWSLFRAARYAIGWSRGPADSRGAPLPRAAISEVVVFAEARGWDLSRGATRETGRPANMEYMK